MLLAHERCTLIVSGTCSFSNVHELVKQSCDCLVYTNRVCT